MEKTKVYTLLYLEDSDDRCGSEIEVFVNEQDARAAMKRQYSQKMSDLRDELDGGDSAPFICDNYACINTDKNFNHYSWVIEMHKIEVPQEVRVKTPLGTLVAADVQNSEYPGIRVDLECSYGEEKDAQISIANVEFGEKLHGKREISIVTFEDMASDDYTRYLQVDSHSMIQQD